MDIDLDDLLAEQPKRVQDAVDRRFRKLIEEFGVKLVREAVGKTQAEVARRMGCTQAHVSKLERQTDMLLSTLKEYVEANDGTLAMTIAFPGGSVSFDSFHELSQLPPLSIYPTERTTWSKIEKGTETVYEIIGTTARSVSVVKPHSEESDDDACEDFLEQLTAA